MPNAWGTSWGISWGNSWTSSIFANVTAFQPGAFQKDAFQIFDDPPIPTRDTHDGLPRRKIRGHKKQVLGNIIRVYREAEELLKDDKQLLSIVDPYVEPETEEEEARRENAQYITDKLPSFGRIDFDSLIQNKIARERFMQALMEIENKINQIVTKREEEEAILMLMFASIL